MTAVEPQEIAGHYVLTTVNGLTPPLDGYEGCDSFPATGRSICGIEFGRLHMQVTKGFRLALVPPEDESAPEVVKGGYSSGGLAVHYTSGVYGEFQGRILATRECAATAGFGNGLTFERGNVTLTFCRDPVNRPDG